AAGGLNNTIRRWDAVTGNPLPGPAAPEGAVTAVACSPNGVLIAAGYSTNRVLLLDTDGKEWHRLVCGPDDAEGPLALSGGGATLFTASNPDALLAWNVATGKESKRFTAPERDEIRCLASSPDGSRVAVGYTNGGVRIWDATSGQVAKQIPMPR